jgi:hypothetical protein
MKYKIGDILNKDLNNWDSWIVTLIDKYDSNYRYGTRGNNNSMIIEDGFIFWLNRYDKNEIESLEFNNFLNTGKI